MLLHSPKFSFRDTKENTFWGVLPVKSDKYTKSVKNNDVFINKVKAHFTLPIELISVTKKSQMLPLAKNMVCFI